MTLTPLIGSDLKITFEIVLMDLEIFFRVIYACLLGCIIGWERERHQIKTAGIRTYGAIALGACAYSVLGLLFPVSDPTRIAAQVVTGIGFLGGGLIFKSNEAVLGLTTAATIWATAAIGIALAFGMYFLGTLTAFLVYLLLYLPQLNFWKKVSGKKRRESSMQ